MFNKFGLMPAHLVDPFFLDGNEPSGGGDDDDKDPPRRRKDPVVTAAKYQNDTTAMARHIGDLEDDNYDLREANRKLKAANKQLEVPEGAVVLTKEQAADWEAYQKLGKPKELETLKSQNEEYKVSIAKSERSKLLRTISEEIEPGVKFDIDIFEDLDSRLGEVTYEKKTVKDENGNSVTKWFAKYKEGVGDKAVSKESSVKELYESKFPKYMKTLVASSTNEFVDGTPYPDQFSNPDPAPGARSGNEGKSIVNSLITSEYGYLTPEKK